MTMVAPLERIPFTAAVLAVLRDLGKPVGDGLLPVGGGWVGGANEPDSYYEPFLVVSEIVASHSSGAIGDTQADWQLPYLIESFGVSREQCSWMADQARKALPPLRELGVETSSAHYGVQQVRIDSIGSPSRVDELEPAVWHSQDGVTLWTGKD